MLKARARVCLGLAAREIAGVERKLETIRDNMRAVARMLVDSLAHGKSGINLDALHAYIKSAKEAFGRVQGWTRSLEERTPGSRACAHCLVSLVRNHK